MWSDINACTIRCVMFISPYCNKLACKLLCCSLKESHIYREMLCMNIYIHDHVNHVYPDGGCLPCSHVCIPAFVLALGGDESQLSRTMQARSRRRPRERAARSHRRVRSVKLGWVLTTVYNLILKKCLSYYYYFYYILYVILLFCSFKLIIFGGKNSMKKNNLHYHKIGNMWLTFYSFHKSS